MNDPIPLLGFTTTALELSAFVLAMLTVYLNIRQNHWAWLFAIVSSAMYAIVFYGARLYGDMGLQGVFIAVSTWGWYQWLFGGVQHTPLKVSYLSRKGWVAGLLAWGLGFVLLAWFLRSYTNSDVPNIDAFLTAGSLVGQVLIARKKIENWIVWIVVDVLYVGLYVYKHLMLTAILYFVFIIMAAVGLVAWRRAARQAP
jgi:nicotinamide mononucleotide transporter